MNKTAIRNFAIWARTKLISDITNKAGMLGVNEKGIAEPHIDSDGLTVIDIGTRQPVKLDKETSSRRDSLVKAINDRASGQKYADAFKHIIEETAYTWFNRLIAVRFMEVNDYLPSGIRALSSINKGQDEPDLLKKPFEAGLSFSDAEREKIDELIDNNKPDELFQLLFIKQCNKLGDILPDLFERTSDYTELLLGISYKDPDGVVYHLVHDISEEDFREQVQIIGWLYQYYNAEFKDEVFADLKKNVKITSETIPAATQLFTPDWIVRYMIENSLGRLWLEGHADSDLRKEWKYYLDEAEQEESVKAQLDELRAEYRDLSPEDIKVIDPCMGSGHILVYAFDVLMQIYLSQGYTERDAVTNILHKNLYGLDIDKRAFQLAYFALMMKARSFDRRFLTRQRDSAVELNLAHFKDFAGMNYHKGALGEFISQFKDAETLGSLLEIKVKDDEQLTRERDEFVGYVELSYKQLDMAAKIYNILSQKYDVVCTNPPYMATSNVVDPLNGFAKNNYPDSKSDLFALFIERCGKLSRHYYAMVTQHAWMFLSSYEKLRGKLQLHTIINMSHLGARAFDEINGEVVQTTAFINLNKQVKHYKGTYIRLVEYTSETDKAEAFHEDMNYHTALQENFDKIPGAPVAYWLSDNFVEVFSGLKLKNFGETRQGFATGNNDMFLRHWSEIDFTKIGFLMTSTEKFHNSKKIYAPCNKGGETRKWYGNNNIVCKFEPISYKILSTQGNHLPSKEYYFKLGLTWSALGTKILSMRYADIGFVFETKGSRFFSYEQDNLYYLMGLMNSKVAVLALEVFCPTIDFHEGPVSNIPVILDKSRKPQIDALVEQNISLSRADWDAFETSWDFKEHPLYTYRHSNQKAEIMPIEKPSYLLSAAYDAWEYQCKIRFDKLKENEEELNRIFIDIYGLQDELTPEVEDRDVTVRKADLQREIKSLISYAVGCMFGRYSLDKEGLVYAGGEWDDSAYKLFIPTESNCIPITDEEYFTDDIVTRFAKFIRIVYGENTLEENLDFIAAALGTKGDTSRQKIRNYFLTDFFKDHCKIYQKRPIYWLFDSGKQNGFKALVYMHRWNADTIGSVRINYLHKLQRIYENEMTTAHDTIDNSADSRAVAKATRLLEKLTKQLKETKDYDAKIAHLALARIDIDLDDGVKVNYEKVQTAPDGSKQDILAALK